jgi:hypothetical protein
MGYFYLEAMAYHILTQCHVTPVHAALVAQEGKGIALCGPSGAGKSSLAYACARRGWTYLSDNESWLVRQAGHAELIGNPARIRFRETAGELFPEIRDFACRLDANGKRSILVSTAGIPTIATEPRCAVSCLIFLDRTAEGADGLWPMDAGEAFDTLAASVPMYEAHITQAHQDSLRRLVDVPRFRMHYRTLDHGVELLDRLVAQS